MRRRTRRALRYAEWFAVGFVGIHVAAYLAGTWMGWML